MNMLNRMMTLLPAMAVLLAWSAIPTTAYSQTPGGRTALAARQHLKNSVLLAMADGKITKLERAEILAEAKEANLTINEYEGLKATMSRLSPAEEPNYIAKRTANQRAVAAARQEQAESPSFFSRMASHIPYIDDAKSGPRPQPSNLAKSVPYMKSSPIDLSGAERAISKAPRLNETYIAQPTVDRPIPKVTRDTRTPSVRTSAKPNTIRKNPAVEKPQWSKYADESITPMPNEFLAPESVAIQQPSKLAAEIGKQFAPSEPNTLAIPAGALLPDRETPPSSAADYSRSLEPDRVDLEFLR
jgi:hypothetical protein